MGRPRAEINLELLRRLRKLGLSWRRIERRYYTETNQEISFMTLKRIKIMGILGYKIMPNAIDKILKIL
jgi:hypothetical protein